MAYNQSYKIKVNVKKNVYIFKKKIKEIVDIERNRLRARKKEREKDKEREREREKELIGI